jgi:hypothetical protein
MSSILKIAQQELCKHGLDTFTDKAHGVGSPGCPHCEKSMYTISQFVDHLANDVLPQIRSSFPSGSRFCLGVARPPAVVIEH